MNPYQFTGRLSGKLRLVKYDDVEVERVLQDGIHSGLNEDDSPEGHIDDLISRGEGFGPQITDHQSTEVYGIAKGLYEKAVGEHFSRG